MIGKAPSQLLRLRTSLYNHGRFWAIYAKTILREKSNVPPAAREQRLSIWRYTILVILSGIFSSCLLKNRGGLGMSRPLLDKKRDRAVACSCYAPREYFCRGITKNERTTPMPVTSIASSAPKRSENGQSFTDGVKRPSSPHWWAATPGWHQSHVRRVG